MPSLFNRLAPTVTTLEDRKDRRDVYDIICKAAEGLTADLVDHLHVFGREDKLDDAGEFVDIFYGEGVEGGFTWRELDVIRAIAICDSVPIDPVDRSLAGGEMR